MRNNCDSVLCELEQLDVLVVESSNQANLCMSVERGRLLCLKKGAFLNAAQKCEVLMHEKAHFKYRLFYQPYSQYVLREQTEYRANKRMFLEHIPLNEIQEQIADQRGTLWELAEYFCVTEQTMQKAIDFYNSAETPQ